MKKHRFLNKVNYTKIVKNLLIFIVFQIFFTSISLMILVFYGPFENLKTLAVGSLWNTTSKQNVARFFLTDEQILNILWRTYPRDPLVYGEELNIMTFGNTVSDKIEIHNINARNFKGRMMIIHDPTRLKVGVSQKIPTLGETTSDIAKRVGAVAAINAGGFIDVRGAGTGGVPMGFIIKDGQVIYNRLNNERIRQDTVGFTSQGMLIVGRHSILQLKEYGIKEAVTFGPPLIVNGNPTITEGDGGWGIAPRTAIGQRRDGAVLLLTIDGRYIDSVGATLREVQDVFVKFDAINAANLDGGTSTTMYFDGEIINTLSHTLGERTVPTIFYVD